MDRIREAEPIKGTLYFKVNKDVVSHLSLGLYRNFARAIKELISNSYDACATEVKIRLDLRNRRVIVRDNGDGMTKKEISDRLLFIATPTPPSEAVSKCGRKRIGTFGIGFLSVFPYCNRLRVVTKKKGQEKSIEVDIDTAKFFDERGNLLSIDQMEASYEVKMSDLPKDRGETIVVLENIKPHFIEELQRPAPRGRVSIEKLAGFERFRWTLCQYAPIEFPERARELKEFFGGTGKTSAQPLKLYLDGEQLFRNVPEGATILDKGEEHFGSIHLKYAIMTTMKPIMPEEARGLQVRLRDVAIGFPKDFEVTKLTGSVPGKMNYIGGEVQILKGLDDALMIDRDTLRFTQDVSGMDNFFRKKITHWNRQLEDWAKVEKGVYEALYGIRSRDKVLGELKRGGVLRFEKLRAPSTRLSKWKGEDLLSPSEKLIAALSRINGYKVVPKKGSVSSKEIPVRVERGNTIIVYTEHPDLSETLDIGDQRFRVLYDEWEPSSTPYSVCKLSRGQRTVVYNSLHPLFHGKISNEIVKRLSLGILLISSQRRDSEELILRLNHLLEDTLLG